MTESQPITDPSPLPPVDYGTPYQILSKKSGEPGTVCGGAETKIPEPDNHGGRRGYSLNQGAGVLRRRPKACRIDLMDGAMPSLLAVS
ncbi:hypothetical protein J6590_050887 [Homalodisca vitripennis]|nr:hypothetical protein J6590_050887 [Homalodisca vitripennis]